MFPRCTPARFAVTASYAVALMFLTACGGGSSGSSGNEVPVGSRAIAAQLEPTAVSRITAGSGNTPVTEGSWLRMTPATSWNWQLQGEVDMSHAADVYVLDLFDQVDRNTIDQLHSMGRSVLCYFSVGTYEHWRPDAAFFEGLELGKPHVSYADERWLDVREPEIVRIMINRLDMAKTIGCDGVELDNVDAFSNDTGLGITAEDQIRFSRVLANEAHRRNLSVALKNSIGILDSLVSWFDLLINEECFQYQECEAYTVMTEAGKPVFNAEYKLLDANGDELPANDPVARERLCVQARALNLRTLILPLALDGSDRFSCDA